MNISQIMTADAQCIDSHASLTEAAERLRDLDIGALPVCEDDRVIGMLTDRDIAVRGVAGHCPPDDTLVRDVMSEGIVFAFDDQDVREAAQIMRDRQIRRLPVLDRRNRLVGMLSLGDMAVGHLPADACGATLQGICQPPAEGAEYGIRPQPNF
jgi:CBS domain-containing protein